ncbi:MAG: hypothetical protein HYR75_02315 [Gemmatimonadetes bacterium]|nr:hypothetical protein [Gemmatimonadota bacterium]MBI3566899.1 hypothetical protein [Gemmatimonadota bacterium]
MSTPSVLRALMLAAMVAIPARARAQGGVLHDGPFAPDPVRARLRRSADSVGAGASRLHIGRWSFATRDSSWWVPLASLVVPGSGQLLLGQPRAIAYAAVEAFTVFGYLNQHSEMVRERNRSQALAHDVARALYPGSLPVGPWAYYEDMEKYVESGVYTRVPGSVVPETDVSSYNGWLWADVRQRYSVPGNVQTDDGSAAYQKAITEYKARAIRDEYRWTWRNAELEQDVYRQAIRSKNQANRDAMANLRLMAANHLLSMLDAFVTLRLSGRFGANGDDTGFTASLPWAPFGRPRTR